MSDETIEVRSSTIHGQGAFARRRLKTGERVGRYGGRRVTEAESAARDWDAALTYLFRLSDGSMIDGSDGGNATRHINHSCAPNCQAWEVEDEDGPAIVIEACRPIAAGEELFIDYSLDIGDDDPAAFVCRCGHEQCRGTMAEARRRRKPAKAAKRRR